MIIWDATAVPLGMLKVKNYNNAKGCTVMVHFLQ